MTLPSKSLVSQVGTHTRKDAAALLQVGETKVKTYFNALIKNGFIERMGQGRVNYYVTTKGKIE